MKNTEALNTPARSSLHLCFFSRDIFRSLFIWKPLRSYTFIKNTYDVGSLLKQNKDWKNLTDAASFSDNFLAADLLT